MHLWPTHKSGAENHETTENALVLTTCKTNLMSLPVSRPQLSGVLKAPDYQIRRYYVISYLRTASVSGRFAESTV